MITKYGYSTVIFAFIILCILGGVSFFTNIPILKWFLIAVGVSIFVFTVGFFRDPSRVTPQQKNIVVSPADGTVLFVKEVKDDRFLKAKALQVSIFMSPLNVHVNRIPVSGKVEYLKHLEGSFFVASTDKACEKNERSEIGISSAFGKVLFTQVAGAVARRIVTDLKPGQQVTIGERFGMIKFGSRVDVIVPANWKAKVNKGDKVTAAESILFEAVQ